MKKRTRKAGAGMGYTPPPGITNGKIRARTSIDQRWNVPPQVSKQELELEENASVFTRDITLAQAENIQKGVKAWFFRRRLDLACPPTKAEFIDPDTKAHKTFVNRYSIATADDADAMADRLSKLGVKSSLLKVRELVPQTPHSSVDWHGDSRRFYYVGNLNVGSLLHRYADYPVEVADQMTLAEI